MTTIPRLLSKSSLRILARLVTHHVRTVAMEDDVDDQARTVSAILDCIAGLMTVGRTRVAEAWDNIGDVASSGAPRT